MTGANVAASSDPTGASNQEGDWELETVVGEVRSPLVVSPSARREYQSTLSITVYALGQTGTEQMELQIDGEVVQQWSNVGGDLSTGTFEAFTYENTQPVTADRIRVAFTNDQISNGSDRNLVIDRVEIDGVAYQTEEKSTFSTGSWSVDTGAVVPGFRRDQWLHTNGFFQFADQNATTIEVDAFGTTGEEQVRLAVGEQVVASWELSTESQTLVASLDRTLTPLVDSVRFEFLNDLYQPDLDVDRNVVVDQIRINGQSLASTAAETYSTGTWTESDGIVPGYLRGETLHTNGYFQFDAPVSTVVVHARGDVGVEQITLNLSGVDVQTFDATTRFQQYSYTHDGPVSPNELRVIYSGDTSAPGQDPNLTLDWIEVDGKRIETESPFIFASGVYSQESQSIVSGYGLGETLNANGYFQFATGSLVEVIARGAIGGEAYELVLGTALRATQTVGDDFETYRYIADGVVGATEVRILYDSDLADPALGDRNLIVDAIRIDGVTYETEVPSTYSSGTGFVNGFVQHGFGHGDTLFVNGFFQYLGAAPVTDDFSIPEDSIAVPLAIAANDIRSEFNFTTPVITSDPSNGTLELIDGDLFYTPDPEFVGTDTFAYDLASNNGSRVASPVPVSVTVNASHQQPQSAINSAVATELSPSGRFLEVRRFAKLPLDANGRQPRMNSFATLGQRSFVVVDGAEDGTGEIYELVTSEDGETNTELFFDVASSVFDNTGLNVNNSSPLFGVRSVAFHPDFATNGKLYIAYTGDRPQDTTGFNYLSDPSQPVPVDNILAEWTVDLGTGQVDAASYRELFRVGMIAADHPIQNMVFNPYAVAGDSDYGLLYIGHGDGSVQSAIAGDGQNADGLGKVLRIDPLAGASSPYTIPADNPFVGDESFPDEIYAVGFRNPHNLTFARDSAGEVHLLVTDIGRDNVEEINLVVKGGNYGWADREGVFVHLGNQGFINGIDPLPQDEAQNGYIYPVSLLGHEGVPGQSFVGQAIIGGHVIQNGSSDLAGQFILAEFATDGRAYHVDFEAMLQQVTTLDPNDPERDSPDDLTWLTPEELTLLFDHDDDPTTLALVRDSLKDVLDDEPDFATILSAGKVRADLRFGQGPDGELYILNKRNGWVYVATNTQS